MSYNTKLDTVIKTGGQTITGGTATTDTLSLVPTTGNAATGSAVIIKTGNNGATEAMRVDHAGNVGIGTNSPTEKLHVESGNMRVNKGDNPSIVYLGGAPSGNWEGDVQFLTSDSQKNWRISSNRVVAGAFAITPSTVGGGDTFTTPSVLVDPNGNVGIGTTSPGAKLDVKGLQQITGESGSPAYIRFDNSINDADGIWRLGETGGATAEDFGVYNQVTSIQGITVKKDGKVGMGTTTPLSLLNVESSSLPAITVSSTAATANALNLFQGGYASAQGLTFINNGSGSYTSYGLITAGGDLFIKNAAHSVGLGTDLSTGWTNIVQILNTGSMYNGTGTYGTISDIKLKENIIDTAPKLNDLLNVRIVNYNLIGKQDKHIGVIAQEVKEVFPALVDELKETKKQEGGTEIEETTLAVKYSVFIPILIKSIQEQQVIINDLKARIEVLENANQ